MTKRFTYKYISQIQASDRDDMDMLDKIKADAKKQNRVAPTHLTVEFSRLYDYFYTHEAIIEQLMDENRRLKRELREKTNE